MLHSIKSLLLPHKCTAYENQSATLLRDEMGLFSLATSCGTKEEKFYLLNNYKSFTKQLCSASKKPELHQ